MKKTIALLCTILLAISLSACSFGSTIIPPSNNGTIASAQENKPQIISVGDKIILDTMEIVINSVELTYDVLPDDTSGFYTHYAADTGKVYISIDASITNTAKQNLGCDDIGRVIADYNNGYTYRGFTVVKDKSTGFTYANITSIDPLETKGIKWLVECPQEVDESSNPLFLEFTIANGKYKLIIR